MDDLILLVDRGFGYSSDGWFNMLATNDNDEYIYVDIAQDKVEEHIGGELTKQMIQDEPKWLVDALEVIFDNASADCWYIVIGAKF